jgi:CheY-like chemotaxis protein
MDRLPVMLVAEDDDETYELVSTSLPDLRYKNQIRRAVDGQDLLDYLHGREDYASESRLTRPVLVLLDLNMPRMDGRRALEEIRRSPRFVRLPVAVFTVSGDENDVRRMYDLGANCYIRKPADPARFAEVLQAVHKFWFLTATTPETD